MPATPSADRREERMLIVISPAKTLDYDTPPKTKRHTKPRFLDHSQRLVNILRNYSALDLAELMHLSHKLAELNFERYQDWSPQLTPQNAKQAVLAMKGDVYSGLDAESFDEEDFGFAQEHLRILSGLYGVLRPLDLMHPYRLEMGTRLANEAGKDLYAFWGETITEALNADLEAQGDDLLVNLASNEYFKSIKPKLLQGRILTPQFKERKGDRYRVLGVYAKKARGLMAGFIVRNRLSQAEDIKGFTDEGYAFDPALSSEDEWVFTRG
jgi:cytoplasmic iron level regulating protein YaaA (DUF328/UPF0246 family)